MQPNKMNRPWTNRARCGKMKSVARPYRSLLFCKSCVFLFSFLVMWEIEVGGETLDDFICFVRVLFYLAGGLFF